jgi:hypothetical protein
MPPLKYLKKQLPIQKGDNVTIRDMFGHRFTVKVDSVSWYAIIATEPLTIDKFRGLQEIPIVNNGFTVIAVNDKEFNYNQFFNIF